MAMKKRISIYGGILAFVLIFTLGLWGENAKGTVIGTIFESDGATPVSGAVVRFENTASGVIFQSSPTDSRGHFQIESMETGVYLYGINSDSGGYYSDGLIGVRAEDDKPARMTLALNRFNEREKIEKMMAAERPGENLIGEIVNFVPKTKLTEIRIIRGVLKKDDRIHVVGMDTDFYQKVANINVNGTKATRIFVNQKGSIKAKKEAKSGDLVYLAQDKAGGFWSFFSGPAGIATLVASTATIGYVAGSTNSDKGPEASAFR